ncbi:hypothetical protein AML66_26030 [Escherichia coli]|nr:hypothetical protein ACP67_26660 [Escherichia coli]KYT90613.1 hypothetical protein AML66_26030 [Escherichia coli]
MIWQPEFTDKTLSRKTGAVQVLPDLSRRGYLSKNASSSNRFGLVNGDGLSKDSRCWCTFSRWRSSMDNAIACSSSLVIVCTWEAIYRSTSHYGKNVLLLQLA